MLQTHRKRSTAFLPTAFLVAMLGAVAPLTGCAAHYIPNTDVRDTDENRKIIAFCERYRKAVENRNVPELLKIASPTYYEDGGNVDASDDLDYEGLRDYLNDKFVKVKSIRYEIRYRRILRHNDLIFIDYTYSASYRITGSKGDEWRRRVEDNRLELVPFQDEFRIVAGM